MEIDSGALRALTVLADERHFGRAAARLGISQQALSKRIQRLEARLGADVIDRTDRRRLLLTDYGAGLLAPARLVLDAVDALPLGAGHGTPFRIDVLDEHLLPMSRVIRAAGLAGLTVDPLSRPGGTTAEHLLLSGRADAAFGRAGAVRTPWPSGIERRLVLLEPLSVLLPRTHPWADLDALPLEMLAGESLWFPMSGAPVEWRDYVAELARAGGIRIDTRGATFGYQQWGTTIAEGLAPPSLIGEEMPPPIGVPLVAVPIVEPTPVFPWSLLWRTDLAEDRRHILFDALELGEEPRAGGDVWLPGSDAALLGRSGERS